MKEKIIILDSSSDVTGALKSSLLIAKALETYDVSFVLPKGTRANNKVFSSGYDVIEIDIPNLRKNLNSIVLYIPALIKCALELRKILTLQGCSTLILNDFDKPLGAILKILGWKGSIYTFVRRRPSSFPRLLAFLWIKNSILSSKSVIAVSNIVLEELPKNKKIVRVYNPIEAIDSKQHIYYPDFDVVVFLCLGNYIMGKGQEEALDSFVSAYQSNTNIRLHFAGGDLGIEKNKLFRRYLMRKVTMLGLEDIVTFDGYVDNVKEVIFQAHVILNFSVSESFSRVCVEAASYGRPVIATKSGGPQEIISHGESGFLVNVGDLISMSKYISWFSENANEVPIMGEKARYIVNKNFSFDNFTRDINKLITK